MTTRDYGLARRMWHQLDPVHAVFWDAPEWRTDRLADEPWLALGPGRTQRLAELAGPLLGAAFESGLLPGQSTLGIVTVTPPAPRT